MLLSGGKRHNALGLNALRRATHSATVRTALFSSDNADSLGLLLPWTGNHEYDL